MENNAKHEKSGKITMKMKIAVKVIENLTWTNWIQWLALLIRDSHPSFDIQSPPGRPKRQVMALRQPGSFRRKMTPRWKITGMVCCWV
jgi:hypothetical protein